ncbi:MAG: arginine--tRNA ligase [Bacteroidia bacterium]|nr:arginine--tRNA ligase [Bacteroidia bacterium]MDW8158317.1 arginine--tRNA ligase [Bacteroidia bacterium]
MVLNSLQIKAKIQEAVAQVLEKHYSIPYPAEKVSIEKTSPDFEGDFTVLLFPLLKLKIGKPEEIGEKIGKYLQYEDIVSNYVVIKGFLNLTLSDKLWQNFILFTNQEWEQFLNSAHVEKPQKILIEYLSPNTNKPLHLGHLRNGFLGASLAQILKAVGHQVNTVCLFNDKGVHICKSMHAYMQNGCTHTPQEKGIKGDHFVGDLYVQFERLLQEQIETLQKNQGLSKEQAMHQAPAMQAVQELYRRWEAQEPEVLDIWKKMNQWVYEGFEQSFETFGFHFDKYYYESQTYTLGKAIVQEGLEKGIFIQKPDGSVTIDLTSEGLDEKILLRSDGTSVYITQDLGTAEKRYYDFAPHISIYVIGNEQDYHMKVLKLILQKLGKPYAQGIYHLSYGMVDLPSGRMKTREGNVVDADEIAQEMILTAQKMTQELGKTEGLTPQELEKLYRILGLGALKYFLLKVDPQKRMLFNPEESIDFKGHTGTFIQYTHARIASVLRKAKEENLIFSSTFEPIFTAPLEKKLVLWLCFYPEILLQAAAQYSPAILANYIYEGARLFSNFWAELPILRAQPAEIAQTRIILASLTGKVISHAMHLLCIEVPEKM